MNSETMRTNRVARSEFRYRQEQGWDGVERYIKVGCDMIVKGIGMADHSERAYTPYVIKPKKI